MVEKDPCDEVRKAWRVLLIDLAFARNYQIAYQLGQFGRPTVRNPVLEKILPSLLYIRMVALLDETLEVLLVSSSAALPKSYRHTLDGRISYFSDSGQIANGAALHEIRKRRNEVAHEGSASIAWSDLDEDLATVYATIQQLGFVGQMPKFEIKAEHSAMKHSVEPGIIGIFEYAVVAMEGDVMVAEWTWRERLLDDEPKAG